MQRMQKMQRVQKLHRLHRMQIVETIIFHKIVANLPWIATGIEKNLKTCKFWFFVKI